MNPFKRGVLRVKQFALWLKYRVWYLEKPMTIIFHLNNGTSFEIRSVRHLEVKHSDDASIHSYKIQFSHWALNRQFFTVQVKNIVAICEK